MKSKLLIQYVLDEGGDLVGIANGEEVQHYDPWRPATGILPQAKSIIVFALKNGDGALDSPNIRLAIHDTLVVYNELNRIGYRLSRYLESKGYEGIAIPAFNPIEMTAESKGMVGDLSLRHAAVSAGMGFIGRNNLLITPQYGPRVRLGAVVTNAKLDATKGNIKDRCGSCNICMENCPAKAISGKTVDIRRCARFVGGPAGLGAMINFVTELTDKSKEEMKRMIRSPDIWNFYQALQLGIYFGCNSCMASCPLGKSRDKKGKGWDYTEGKKGRLYKYWRASKQEA